MRQSHIKHQRHAMRRFGVRAEEAEHENEELARRRELARKTQAAADQAKLDQAAVAAKERAWQQFYRPPKKCDHPPDWDTQVECGNAHIRAKKEFQDRWSH